MPCPLRLEFADALYHVTSRGDRREDIYHDGEFVHLGTALVGGRLAVPFGTAVHQGCALFCAAGPWQRVGGRNTSASAPGQRGLALGCRQTLALTENPLC